TRSRRSRSAAAPSRRSRRRASPNWNARPRKPPRRWRSPEVRIVSQGQTIVIRRKRHAAHDAHHGGAWKIAYADFVTAMMAFFMLLWLISNPDKVSLKGLADYFSVTPAAVENTAGAQAIFGGEAIGKTSSAQSGSPSPGLRVDPQSVPEA